MDLASVLEKELVDAEVEYLPLQTGEEFSSGPQEVTCDDSGDSEAVLADEEPLSDIVAVDFRPEDHEEESLVSDFHGTTCGCKLGVNKTACSAALTVSELASFRDNCKQFSNGELDAAVLAQIHSQFQHSISQPSTTESCQANRRCTNAIAKFFYNTRPICRRTFLFLHGISNKRYSNLVDHYKHHGVTPRDHGLRGHSPPNTTCREALEDVLAFIVNFASAVALPIPGRLPNFKNERVLLLPTDMTKIGVYRKYVESCQRDQKRPVGKSTFLDLWNKQVPYISVTKPATDLCWDCQQNMNLVIRSSNLSMEEKSDRLLKAQKYLESARAERSTIMSAKIVKRSVHHQKQVLTIEDQCITHSILPNRCIILPMHYSQVRFSLRQLGDARFLGYAASLNISK